MGWGAIGRHESGEEGVTDVWGEGDDEGAYQMPFSCRRSRGDGYQGNDFRNTEMRAP